MPLFTLMIIFQNVFTKNIYIFITEKQIISVIFKIGTIPICLLKENSSLLSYIFNLPP